MQDVENLQENGTPQEEERVIQTRRPQIVRMQSNGVTSSTDESDTSSGNFFVHRHERDGTIVQATHEWDDQERDDNCATFIKLTRNTFTR
jgi:hypothetical protein